MRAEIPTMSDLIGEAYEAAIGRGSWESLLRRTAQLFSANAVLFNHHLRVVQSPQLGDAQAFGDPHLFLDGLRSDYQGPDILLADSIGHKNSVGNYSSIGANPRLRKTSLYNEGLRGQVEHIATNVAGPSTSSLSYACLCRPAEEAPFSDIDIENFKLLSVHLNRAKDASDYLSLHARQDILTTDPINLLRHAVILLRGDGEIVHANAPAKEILESGPCLIEGVGNVGEIASAAWSTAIRGISNSGGVTTHRARYGSMESARYVTALLMPAPTAWVSKSDNSLFALIIGTGLDAQQGPPDWILRAQYQVTNSEIRFLRAFLRFLNIEGAAASLGLTRETGRRYIKVIFEKTDTHSQVELLSLLLNHPLSP